MRKFFSFIYHLIFVDSTTDKLSHTKMLSVLSGFVMIAMFPYAVIYGDNAGAELWLIFCGLTFGSRQMGNFLKQKYGKKD